MNTYIYALGLNSGGGYKILYDLFHANKNECIFLIDDRIKNDFLRYSCENVYFFKNNLLGIYKLGLFLKKKLSPNDILISINSIPPFQNFNCNKVCLINNKLLFLPSRNLYFFIKKIIFFKLIKKMNLVIFQTPTIEKISKKYFNGIPTKIIPFINLNNINIVINKYKNKNSQKILFYPSDGYEHKNHLRLIEAFINLANQNIYPKLILTIDENQFKPLINFLDDTIVKYKLDIENHGVLSLEEVYKIYSNIDALIYPSLNESFGIPLLEAKKFKLPIIAPELDYVRDSVDPDFVFDPNSSVSISRAVMRFLNINLSNQKILSPKNFIREVKKNFVKDNSLNLLFVNQYFWPETFHINEVALELKKRKYNLDVVTGKPNYPSGKIFKPYKFYGYSHENWNSINIHRVPLVPRCNASSLSLFINYLSFIFFSIFSPVFYKKKKYDLIFVYGTSPIFQILPALIFSKIKKIPLVLWLQDIWPESLITTKHLDPGYISKLIKFFVNLIYKNCDLILTQSPSFVNFLPDELKPKIFYHPCSADDNYLNINHLFRKKINSLNNKFSFLYTGNIGEAQGFDNLLLAIKELRDYPINFVFIGNGSYVSKLINFKNNNNLNNIFHENFIDKKFIPDILQQASVLLLSLKNDVVMNNTIPNKLQVYLASGKPIFGCISGVSSDIINQSKSGLCSANDDLESIKKNILKLYKFKKIKLNQLGLNGKKFFIQNYKLSDSIDLLEKHFYNLINR